MAEPELSQHPEHGTTAPRIDFAASERSSVGIEWELALVDRSTGALVSAAEEVLSDLASPDGTPHPRIVGELLQNTVELVSTVHRTVPDAVDDLRGLLAETRRSTDARGIALVGSGSHPFAQWQDQPVADKERYHTLIERTRWWGRNMLIWGVHVHVGIEDVEKVMPILTRMLRYCPHLLALSSSSPYWAGIDTGYASNRSLMFQQLPTAGLPYQLPTWSDFERYVHDQTVTGIIRDYTEIRWDLRPSPHWGTIEIRFCDCASSVREIAAIAALIHCLVEDLSTAFDEDDLPEPLQDWFVKENKWRAARYGLDAEIIVASDGSERLVTDDIRELVARLAPVAERLGCADELRGVLGILEEGASYARQRNVAEHARGDLTSVVEALARELHEGA